MNPPVATSPPGARRARAGTAIARTTHVVRHRGEGTRRRDPSSMDSGSDPTGVRPYGVNASNGAAFGDIPLRGTAAIERTPMAGNLHAESVPAPAGRGRDPRGVERERS